jgi:putative transposase
MSRAGNVWDRAMETPPVRETMARSAMESFFSSLKTERTVRKVHRTRDEARADVFDHIERFSNPRRWHSKLGDLSPTEFEARAMPA